MHIEESESQNGDEWSTLYADIGKRMLSRLIHKGFSIADAEDLTQEAFVRVMTVYRKKPYSELALLLWTTCQHLIVDRSRSASHRREILFDITDELLTGSQTPERRNDSLDSPYRHLTEALTTSPTDIEDKVDSNIRLKHLYELISSLPGGQKKDVLLEANGFSIEESAALTGKNLNAVRQSRFRARRTLKELLTSE